MLLKRNRHRSANLFEAYLSHSEHEHDHNRKLLSNFLENIELRDNLVQDSCEKDHRESGLDISNCQLHIGYMDVKERSINFWC